METNVNNKCRVFTSLEQSKKLAEILPIESADQTWERIAIAGANLDVPEEMEYWHNGNTSYILNNKIGIPCWSLAALLNIIPKHIKQNDGRTYKFHIFNDDGIVIQRWGCSYVAKDYHNRAEYLSDPKLKYPTNIYSGKYEDILDACYNMIIKLHEQKLL